MSGIMARRRPKTGRRPMPREEHEQAVLADWLDSSGVLWCHVANERRCSIQAGARLKRLGVKAGVPDVLIFTPAPRYEGSRGVALELKSETGRVSESQLQWLDGLHKQGWITSVRHGAMAAIEWLRSLGYGS